MIGYAEFDVAMKMAMEEEVEEEEGRERSWRFAVAKVNG